MKLLKSYLWQDHDAFITCQDHHGMTIDVIIASD